MGSFLYNLLISLYTSTYIYYVSSVGGPVGPHRRMHYHVSCHVVILVVYSILYTIITTLCYPITRCNTVFPVFLHYTEYYTVFLYCTVLLCVLSSVLHSTLLFFSTSSTLSIYIYIRTSCVHYGRGTILYSVPIINPLIILTEKIGGHINKEKIYYYLTYTFIGVMIFNSA